MNTWAFISPSACRHHDSATEHSALRLKLPFCPGLGTPGIALNHVQVCCENLENIISDSLMPFHRAIEHVS